MNARSSHSPKSSNAPSLARRLAGYAVLVAMLYSQSTHGANGDNTDAARELLDLMQVKQFLAASFQNATNPEARIADLYERLAGIYAEEFTRDELVAIAAFYRTPAGATLAKKQSVLSERTFDAFQAALSGGQDDGGTGGPADEQGGSQ